MIIYLSGAMSRYMDSYKAVFAAKQAELEAEGHVILNPACLPVGLNDAAYMPICTAMIDAADAIYLFHHWKESRGAILEKLYSEYQGKRVIYCGENGTTS